jgi:hypothetical protein
VNPVGLPRPEDCASAALTVRAGELFNPPGLTNRLGCLQAAFDLAGVQHVTFPPYSCGDAVLGACALNGTATAAAGVPLTFRWRPDRIERAMEFDGFALASTTVMAVGAAALAVEVRVRNLADRPREARLRLLAGEGVVRSDDGWRTPDSPRESPRLSTTPWEGTPPPATLVRNTREAAADGLILLSRTSAAALAQRTAPPPTAPSGRAFEFVRTLGPGEESAVVLHVGVGPDRSAALAAATPVAFQHLAAAAAADWTAELAAAFTPGNDRFGGHLPTLATRCEPLRALYLNAVLAVLVMRRITPHGPHPHTYVTLMPRYWVTTSFLNDWSLTALLLVLLDPACVRAHAERWLERGVERHFGLEYVSGASTGNWYSCNAYAMTRLISTYVRVTGDEAWLDRPVAGRTVAAHLDGLADHVLSLDRGSGLGDYGDRNSLLEAVGTYEHEVASLNAAAAWVLREVAVFAERRGGKDRAAALRGEARRIAAALQELAAEDGSWRCRGRDGTLTPVRHVWDFIHVLNLVPDDVPAERRDAMVRFFARELQTPEWLAALSPLDEDAGFSLRPDHQWNGSYPAWVALAVGALARAGQDRLLADWLPGLARATAQGPLAQAHFTAAAAPLLAGGARKAPTEWPYITDWAALCAGSFLDVIVLDLFGAEFGFDRLTARPRLAVLDPGAELRNVRWRGGDHTIRADGKVVRGSSA